MKADNNYDIILIGSGIGALTVASIMAQFKKKKVLLLEKHFTAGGFTHVFKRKRKFLWDVGIHYIGDLDEDALLRRLFNILSKNKISWQKMPELFEKFVYPDFTFSVYANKEKYLADLTDMFPDESENLKRYFEDIKAVNTWFGRHLTMKGKPTFVDLVKSKADLNNFNSVNITTKQYLEKNFVSEKLRALLASQWGDYGLPPKHASFLIHSVVVQHYLNGGYYPKGGSGVIAQSIIPIIEDFGGKVLTSHQVDEVIIKDNKAIGVKATYLRAKEDDGKIEFYAPTIISNAGAYNTYTHLLAKSASIPFQNQLETFYKEHPVVTNVTLYLGLSKSPTTLGFHGENHWIYDSYNHDKNFQEGSKWITKNEMPPGAYLSFPSMKDSEAEGHTAEIIAFADYEPFKKWKDQPWKKRDEEYKKLKEQIIDSLLNYIEKWYPGFKDIIEFKELSTPITTQHFTSHPQGSIYGVTCVPERFYSDKAPWCQAETPIENLFLTGADVSSPGVAGALMGGIATVGKIPDGLSMMKVIRGPK